MGLTQVKVRGRGVLKKNKEKSQFQFGNYQNPWGWGGVFKFLENTSLAVPGALAHCLLNSKWPLGGLNRVWKGV